MSRVAPSEVELSAFFRRHLGPRNEAAGLRVEFHYNQTPGIHFKVSAPKEYRDAITEGLKDGLAQRFPDLPATTAVWVLEVMINPVEASRHAFYCVGRMVIDQAFSLVESGAAPSDETGADASR